MLSATPHGVITLISTGFGGRTTDKTILDESGFFEVLPNNCQIMVDRGFRQFGMKKFTIFLIKRY
jgi:hypothetical protein